MKGTSVPPAVKLIAKNKKAYFNYEVLEKYEAGIVLTGAEVKSIKGAHVQLKGSFVTIINGRARTENMHVSPYKYSVLKDYDPMRRRELLLKKKELDYLAGMTGQKGFTIIPLEIFLKRGLVKILIGVCRGKKQHDKRQVMRGRAIEREISQGLKRFSRG